MICCFATLEIGLHTTVNFKLQQVETGTNKSGQKEPKSKLNTQKHFISIICMEGVFEKYFLRSFSFRHLQVVYTPRKINNGT